MALTYDQISAITKRYFVPKFYDNVFDVSPLLKRIKQKSYQKIGGGTSILVPLEYNTNDALGWYSGEETLDTSDTDIGTAAEYQWKQLYVNISVKGIDEIKNGGDAQVIDFVKVKVKNAEKSAEDYLGTGLYQTSTANAKSIIGLRAYAASISSTVGGISQTDYSWWRPQLDSSTTTLTIAAMRSRMQACSINNDKPSVISTTDSLYNAFYALLQPQQRFQDEKMANAGFTSLMFEGIPVLPDSYCPSSHMFFLNEEYLMFKVHKDRDMKFEPFMKPINQDVKSAKILWAGAFCSANGRMQGAMSALTG
jgi:hypothetical protein